MKSKFLCSILSVAMIIALAFTGCGKAETTKTEVESEETGSELTDVEEADASDSDKSQKITGGTPWIDSEFKDNVTSDTPTDPKDDFHLYANKDWLLENEIPDGYSTWSHYNERALEVKQQCMELLKDGTISGHDAELIRTFNDLILDWDTRDKLGISEGKEYYEKLLAAENLDDITKLLTEKDTVDDYYNFVSFGATTGLNVPDTYLVVVDSSSLLLGDSAEYTNRSDYGDMLYGLRKDGFIYMAGKFGMSESDAENYFEKALELETKLSKKIYTTEDTHKDDFLDKVNNEMTFEEVTVLTEAFPLKEILTNSGYKYDGPYLVPQPDYLKLLDTLYTEENFEAIKGRALISYVLSYSSISDHESYKKMIELQNTYTGSNGSVSDEEMAYNMVNSGLTTSMEKVYISKYGSPEDKKKMTELCQQVIDTYRELLSENDWASDETKNYAIEKLDKMIIHAAYPDKFRDTSNIDISDCTLIEASEVISDVEQAYNISLIGKKVDKEMWAEGFDILACNAFYSSQENTINMIIGMMGEPFYSSDMSTEELYASIGAFWVGHEISHAFDSNGAQFDAEGQYRDWWTSEDKAEFKKRVKKMDDYLDTIVAFNDNHFIGTNIDTEMVADMTGLQCALRMASKVDGFDYDKFFTKYAQMNVSLQLYSSEYSLLTQDEHPLDYSRTNVPVQQFQEFYNTYDVKEGDNMYLAPEDRLVIW
ncbi:MAG: M13 family metallopeptidase [Pseudobutyrivibrio sp.]|nr:M13 family metallopeptidase [Pseudobutyrivibrio sp.]